MNEKIPKLIPLLNFLFDPSDCEAFMFNAYGCRRESTLFHSKRERTTVDRSSFSLLPKHRGQGAFQVFSPFFSLSLQSSFPKCSPSTSLQQMCHFALPSAHFSHFLSSHLPRKFLDSSRPLVRVSSASEVIAFSVDFRLIACFLLPPLQHFNCSVSSVSVRARYFTSAHATSSFPIIRSNILFHRQNMSIVAVLSTSALHFSTLALQLTESSPNNLFGSTFF